MKKRNVKMLARHRVANAAYLDNAIANTQPAPAAEVARVMADVRLSYEKLRTGIGAEQDYRIAIYAVNVGMIRAEAIDTRLVGYFKAAGEALTECGRIQAKHGKYGFPGPGILAMNAALEFYEQLLTLSSQNQMHAAATEADRRYRDGYVVTV